MTQSIVLSDCPRHSAVLVLKCASPSQLGKSLASTLRAGAIVAGLDPAANCELGIGFGANSWRALSPIASPKRLRDFTAIEGPRFKAVATQADLLVIGSSERADLVFEMIMSARRALPECEVVEEIHGFRYLDSRDLTGFVDGIGNPPVEERADVALVDSCDPSFAGGSFAFVSRWIHDLSAVARMPVREREKMIGRTLGTSEELSETELPDDAHIRRVEIEENGKELAIYRRSFPYGDTRENGLCFLAFTKDPATVVKMLERMYGITDGKDDRLLAVTRAASGGFYFMPSKALLETIARAR